MSYLERLLGGDEAVQFRTHRHWTAFAGRIWAMVIVFLVAFAVAVFLNLLISPGGNASLAEAFQRWPGGQQLLLRAGIFVVLLVVPASALVQRYLAWQLEQYVVTNLRVIQLKGILSKQVLDSSLEKVNDVMLEQSLLGRILNFGNLEILTASEAAINKFSRLARPLAFKAAMLDAKQRLEGTGRLRVG